MRWWKRRALALPAVVVGGLAAAALAAAATAFQVVASPSPLGASLAGTSFDASGDGWAVGSFQSPVDDAGLAPLTERWNGASWQVVTAPDTQFNDDKLAAVAALSPTNAWAVGQRKRTGFKSPVTPLVLHWDGSAWSVVATPVLSFNRYALSGIAAVSASDIWAVGTTFSGPLIEHWNGQAWSVVSAPAQVGGNLVSVSATGPNDVWAVGSASSGTFVEHWNGSAWTIVPSPNVPPQNSRVAASDLLTGVTALSADDVWASGYSIDVASGSFLPLKTLVEHWNGRAWSIVASPSPRGHNVLAAIRARAANDVWAVGAGWTDQATGVPVEQPELLHWNGAAWSSFTPPTNVGASDNFLTAVTSVGTTFWAVGNASGGTLIYRGP